MRVATTVAAVVCLFFANLAQAKPVHRLQHHKPFARMSAAEVRDYLKAQVWHDRSTLRWYANHPQFHRRTIESASRSVEVRWFNVSLKISLRHLAQVERKLAVPAFPPHHALWMCIHGHEAGDWHNQDTGHNGHWGGLQMHPGWYGGPLHLASSDSQMTQEWAAERGYRASGYSRAWLYGQWAHSDCLAYA